MTEDRHDGPHERLADEEDKRAGSEPAPGPTPRAEPAPDPASDPTARPEPASDPTTQNVVLNQFFDQVHIGAGQLGIGPLGDAGESGSTPRRRTGSLPDIDIQRTLRFYVRPKTFAAAETILESRGLVLLDGPEGIGKSAGARALLVPRPIVGLPPALTLDELASYSFRNGTGYLLQDWGADTGRGDSLAFEIEEVSRSLRDAGASLVITTRRPMLPRALRDVAVRWMRPDANSLIEASMPTLTPSERERVDARFAGGGSPRDIVAFADALVAADGKVDEVERVLDEAARDVVAQWFDALPTLDEVLFVAALAFFHGVREMSFERALAALRRAKEALEPPEPPAPERAAPAADREDEERSKKPAEAEPKAEERRPFEQTRRVRATQTPLVALQQDSAGERSSGTERRLVFEAPSFRGQVLEELWSRYGDELWEPVAIWLDDSVADSDEEARLSVSLGIALLAQVTGGHVRNAFLERWAAGTLRERSAAAYTLWWLALSDSSAPFALAIATAWASGRDEHKRVTATLCLCGELGLRFPGEAMRWLWHLATGDTSAAIPAQLAIVDLFRASTLADEADTSVLSYLDGRLAKARRERGVTSASYSRILIVLSNILGCRGENDAAVATLLVNRPEAANLVGRLWAETLISRPFRGDALVALRRALRNLERVDGTSAVIGVLGTAIVAELPPNEVGLLKRDLLRELTSRGASDDTLAQAIVGDLLVSADRSTPEDEEEVA